MGVRRDSFGQKRASLYINIRYSYLNYYNLPNIASHVLEAVLPRGVSNEAEREAQGNGRAFDAPLTLESAVVEDHVNG